MLGAVSKWSRFRKDFLSAMEQNAIQASARRGAATQNDMIYAVIYARP